MSEVPAEITKFVHENFVTVDELRVFLLACRSPDKEWDAWTISSMLYLKPDVTTLVLSNLQDKGLLVNIAGKERVYKYAPKKAKLDALAQKMVELDQTQPVTLINLVYARPKEVQAFAEAFKLNKDKEN